MHVRRSPSHSNPFPRSSPNWASEKQKRTHFLPVGAKPNQAMAVNVNVQQEDNQTIHAQMQPEAAVAF